MAHPYSTVEVEVSATGWEVCIPRDMVLPQRVLDFQITYPELLEELDLNRYAFREIRKAITEYSGMHYEELEDCLDHIVLGNWKKMYTTDVFQAPLLSLAVEGNHTETDITEMLRHLHEALGDMDYEKQIIASCLDFGSLVYNKPSWFSEENNWGQIEK